MPLQTQLATMTTIRMWIARNIASVMFLLFYFITIVAGSLLYASPIGVEALESAGFPSEALAFNTTFTVGYWVLLLVPFVVVPIVVPLLRPVAQKIVNPIANHAPDFRRSDYVFVTSVFYTIAAMALYRTDAFALASNTGDAILAINSRFALQGELSFWEKVVIHSILPALAWYSVVAALKTSERFWLVMSAINVATASLILFVMNMKWPILIFYLGVVVALFIFSKRYAYTRATAGTIALMCIYLVISVYVFRMAPDQEVPHSDPAQAVIATDDTRNGLVLDEKPAEKSKLLTFMDVSVRNAPFLFAHAVNRMAVSYPYYYSVFTEEGPVCGNLLAYVTPGDKPCHPSTLIYTRIFGADGFEGRGTAPAAPHITGYALGGWPVAVLGLIGMCAVLAVFSAIPLAGSTMAGTFVVIGATVGYHFSQIPGEGPIMYDHGFLWPLLLVGAYSIARLIVSKRTKRATWRGP